MLQSSKLTTFTVFELLEETLQVVINQRYNSDIETSESFFIYKFRPNLLFGYKFRTKDEVKVKLLSVIRNQNFIPLLQKTKRGVTWSNADAKYGQKAGDSFKSVGDRWPKFFDTIVFLSPSLGSGSRFMSMLLLVRML